MADDAARRLKTKALKARQKRKRAKLFQGMLLEQYVDGLVSKTQEDVDWQLEGDDGDDPSTSKELHSDLEVDDNEFGEVISSVSDESASTKVDYRTGPADEGESVKDLNMSSGCVNDVTDYNRSQKNLAISSKDNTLQSYAVTADNCPLSSVLEEEMDGYSSEDGIPTDSEDVENQSPGSVNSSVTIECDDDSPFLTGDSNLPIIESNARVKK